MRMIGYVRVSTDEQPTRVFPWPHRRRERDVCAQLRPRANRRRGGRAVREDPPGGEARSPDSFGDRYGRATKATSRPSARPWLARMLSTRRPAAVRVSPGRPPTRGRRRRGRGPCRAERGTRRVARRKESQRDIKLSLRGSRKAFARWLAIRAGWQQRRCLLPRSSTCGGRAQGATAQECRAGVERRHLP